VWDEAAASHITAGTFGQRLGIIRANTAQAGAPTTITLDASASAVNDFYNGALIHITAGTGAGQSRPIMDYAGATKIATVPAWATNPANDSVFVIVPATMKVDVHALAGVTDSAIRQQLTAASVVSGVVLAGSANSITALLDPTPAQDDQFNQRFVVFDVATQVTPNLRGTATRILDSTSGGVLTVATLPIAPGLGDTFTIQHAALPVTITSAGHVEADTIALYGDQASASRLSESAKTIATAVCDAGSTESNIVTLAINPAAAELDQFKGRIALFKYDTTTTNLQGQGTRILASSADGQLTVDPLTDPPVAGDEFCIL
jgi:hypothetical protein